MHAKDTQVPSYQLLTSLTVTKDWALQETKYCNFCEFSLYQMDSVLIYGHRTKMFLMLSFPNLSYTCCMSITAPSAAEMSAYLSEEKWVQSPSDITHLPAFCECSISTDTYGIPFIDKKTEQLPFNITVLRKHYLNMRPQSSHLWERKWDSKRWWQRSLKLQSQEVDHLEGGLEDIHKALGFWKLVVHNKIKLVEEPRTQVYPLRATEWFGLERPLRSPRSCHGQGSFH